ncbi:hypothetical protein LCGC14_0541330 [marine sediment metagenome]|uniref:Uncharacterized protein n=1 Tax=marine sediment metagenome TaxID=412755 RepID=A0A0F9RXF7_9ZZZZ
MPIKDVSDVRRMPRLGKIRLGVKVEVEGKNPYPRATDHFVVPDEIKRIVGDEPKKLSIMFPTENPEEFAQQWYRCYSFSQGLICKGDGATAVRKVDVANGDIASHTTEEWARKEWGCDPEMCEQYLGKQCRRVMNLLFLIPEVPGLGVWQLDTTSFYSIVNINSCLASDGLIRRLCGRVSFIPLVLSLEPQIVEPEGIKKKTVNILQIRSEVKLAEIQKLGRVPPEKVLLPPPDEDEIPTDLIPEEIAGRDEPPVVKGKTPAEPVVKKPASDINEDDVPTMDAVIRFCSHFWGMKPVELCGELGYKTMAELKDSRITPWVAWLTIKQLKQPSDIPSAPEPAAAAPEPAAEPAAEPVAEPAPVPEPGPPPEDEVLWPEDLPGAGESPAAPGAEPSRPPGKSEETAGFIDIPLLKAQLKKLRAKNLKAWEEVNLLSYLKSFYKVEGKTVLEAVAKLDQGAATHFMKRVQDSLPIIK